MCGPFFGCWWVLGPAHEAMTSRLTWCSPSNPEHRHKVCAPEAGWVKMCTNGSYANDGTTDVCMVLRDVKDTIIFSSADNCKQLFSCHEALEAKLCSCMEGLSIAI